MIGRLPGPAPSLSASDPGLARKIVTAGLVLLAIFVCFQLIQVFARGQVDSFVLVASTCLVLVWTFFARDAWWIILPVALSFGGYLSVGFKIYVHEIGLLLSFLPMLVSVAVKSQAHADRSPVPRTAHVLMLYLLVHFIISSYLAKVDGLPGLGHIARVYMQAFWPLIFLPAFLRFGKTTPLRAAFFAMYVASLLRIVLGLLCYFFPGILYVPGIDFILPATTVGIADLRGAALIFASLNICLACMSKSWSRRALHVLLVVAAGGMALMGGGR